jgi:hypothetical protein
MIIAHIKKGVHAGRSLAGVDFPMVESVKLGSRGFYVTVNGEGLFGFPQRNFRIFLQDRDDVEVRTQTEGETSVAETAETVLRGHDGFRPTVAMSQASATALIHRPEEPYEIVRERMIERFGILAQLAVSAARGGLTGLVVYGAPGIGKSYEVIKALSEINVVNKAKFMEAQAEGIDPDDLSYGPEGPPMIEDPDTGLMVPQIVSYLKHTGHITASALYNVLYNNRHPGNILLIDDSDNVLYAEESISLLKSALDSSDERVVMWTISGSRTDDLPLSFEFKGSVIFITNTNFEVLAKSNAKTAPHIEAILDRCLYLNLMIETLREKLVRIDYVCRDLGMFGRTLTSGADKVPEEQVDHVVAELLDWTHENAHHFLHLSVRKMSHLVRMRKSTQNWQRVAEVTLLSGVR